MSTSSTWSATPPLHPHRLATTATLAGQTAPLASAANILILGVEDPGDIVPFAAYLPDAQIVGVDVLASRLGRVQSAVDELELTNVTLLELPLTVPIEAEEPFDYIIIRDALTRLEPTACGELLGNARRALSNNGLLVVGYKALPGWQPVADFATWIRARLESSSIEQSSPEDVREVLAPFLPTSEEEPPASRAALVALSRALASMNDEDIEQLVLDPTARGHRLMTITSLASDAGLHYLGDSDRRPAEAQLSNELEEDISGGGTPSRTELEALVDLSMPRSQRYSVFSTKPPSTRRGDAIVDLDIRFLSLRLLPESGEVDLAPGQETFLSASGTSIEIESRLLRATLGILSEVWPRAVPVPAVLDRAANALATVSSEWASEITAEHVEETKERLIELCSMGLAELRTEPLPVTKEIDELPRVHGLVRYQASLSPTVTSPSHVEIELGPFLRTLALTLDGNHDAEGVERKMTAALDSGALELEIDDKPPTDELARQLVLRSRIIEGLRSLRDLGLLANSPRRAETEEV
jgi:hypothetical protein